MDARILTVCSLLTLTSSALAGRICVSPDGVSPQAALERIRAAKAAGDRSAWTVRVAPGLYALDRTLVFTPADSGTPEAPVRWVAEEGEAVFSGGGLIGGWKDVGDGVWEAPLPRDADGKPIWFQSLFANGRRTQRARHPEKGFFAINGWRETATTNGAEILYHEHYTVKDRAADALTGLSPQELAAVEFQIRCKWSYGSYSVLGWDPATRELSADGREGVKSWKRPDEKGTLFAFENVRAGFDTPGEWFYDVTEGKVKYRPLPGERLADFQALAPLSQLVSIIRFDGDPEHGKYVTDISFEGVTVTCSRTDGDRLPNGFVQQYQYQAGSYAGGGVFAKGARRLTFENCRIFGVENYAMRFDIGCVSNRIVHCTFEDLGAGGLWIGGGKSNLFKKPDGWKEQRTPFTRPIPYGDPAVAHTHPCAFFTVEDCTIRHAGLVNPEGCGIVLTHVSDSSVTHCDISDLYYTGISVGWTWGYSGSVSQRNTIAFNRIWDLGKHVMADMGGIYTLGTSYGTCISNNVIHHVDSVSYGGWGLYNDEGSEGIVLENNLVYDTKDSSYHQHYGRENVVRNNILACSKESQIAVSRPEQHLCVSFLNNIVYWETKTPVFSPGKKPVSEGAGKLAWTNNLFWCAAGPTVINGPNKAIVCDPLFENAAKRDFRLKPGSPAPQYGFKPWDFSTVGRRPADITRSLQSRIETPAGEDVAETCPVSPKAKGHENIEWNRLWAVHLTDASKDLPRALLVGDSICEEYGGAVERTLAGKVNVDRWASSYCLTSPGYRDLLAASLAVAKYDVVHFNNGLHSLSSDRDLWEAKLEEALRLVRRMQPQAKIVLATSTPLRPERLTAKVRELNERLLAVAGRQALPVNDLFALLDPLDRQAEWADDFHHKQPVKDRLARQVADKVLQLLGSGCP